MPVRVLVEAKNIPLCSRDEVWRQPVKKDSSRVSPVMMKLR
jgi:hypothetical protein